MRLILSLLLALITTGVTGGMAHAEVACADVNGTPAALAATSESVERHAAEFPAEGGDLTIFAAASLTDAFNDIAEVLMAEHPHLDIVIETAGSQTLVTQLQEGANADVLATADIATMQRANDAGLIDGEPVIFTGNRLVIITPATNPAGIESINDLANDDVRLVLANPEVPVGNYSNVAFCEYAMSADAPGGFIEGINTNLVSEEPDVRHVLTRVQLGEADAGVVYASDASASTLSGVEVRVIDFPESVPTRAEYPIAAVQGGNTELANAFIAFVLSDEGQEILARYGFQ